MADIKITKVEAEVWKRDLPNGPSPAWSPGTTWKSFSTTLYRVHTDAGITGIGASRGSPQVVRDLIAPKLVGQDPFRIERLFRTMVNSGGGWSALSIACGIEIALWDLAGKVAGLPLYKLWGADKDRVRAYASMVEVRTPEERGEDALRLLDRGYTAIKLRLHSETLKEDIAHVEAVRRAVGDRMAIMVDANQAQEPGTPGSENDIVWGYDRALATARELAQFDVEWLEEPLGRYEYDNLTRLAVASDVPIAGAENNIGLHEFRTLIDQNCYDVLQPDAAVAGVGVLRKVASYAEMHHLPVAPHHGGSGPGVAVHLHLSASWSNSGWLELLQDPPKLEASEFQGLLVTPLVPEADGYVRVPDGPGLGVELSEKWTRVE